MSRIVTFYSYKGGVGRTLSLANIGILLARKGKRVLLMDWDLEAPGLDRYFSPYRTGLADSGQGVAQLLCRASTDMSADWRTYVQEVKVALRGTEEPLTLSLIPSGAAAPDYTDRVRGFSWSAFLAECGGGSILERWRGEWKEAFDMVLIDSRTGITDAGGICTILLPDFLVLVLTANEQSYEGSLAIAQSAQAERRRLSVQRAPLMILPLLSRFDRRDEIEESDKWLHRLASGLKPLYADWLPSRFDPMQILEVTKIPYVTRFSFGEPLPVVTQSLTDPDLPGYYLENCTRLLATDFRDAARIIDPQTPDLPDIAERIRAFIQRAPVDEQELNRLVRQADEDWGEGAELASLLNEIGRALSAQGDPSSAETFYRRALAMDERFLGADHASVASDLNNLAVLLSAMNRYAEAEAMLRRALAIGEKGLGQNHTTMAVYLNNLALTLQAAGRLGEVEALMRRALAIDEAGFGRDHPNVARHLNNLALLMERCDRLAEVGPLLRQALDIGERALGPDHPDVATGLVNLALHLQRIGHAAEVEPLLRRALAIHEQHYGAYHPEVATDLSHLGQFLDASGRLAEAQSLMRRALEIDEKNLGSHHPKVAKHQSSLGGILMRMGRLPEAQALSRRALVTLLRTRVSNGYPDPNFDGVLENYREVLSAMSCTPRDIGRRLLEVVSEAAYHQSDITLLFKEMTGSEHPAGQDRDADKTNPDARETFDCFLSHDSRDKPAVRALAKALRERGISVWLDEERLRPGVPWQSSLMSGIQASRSVAVLVGAGGIGPWEVEEMAAALSLAVKQRRPVIPVLLPNAPAAPAPPLFLANRTWVDMRPEAGPSRVSPLDQLIWGITGQLPDKTSPEISPDMAKQRDDGHRVPRNDE